MSIKEIIKVANYYNIKYNNFNKFAIPAIPPSMSKPPPGAPPGYKKLENEALKKALLKLNNIGEANRMLIETKPVPNWSNFQNR